MYALTSRGYDHDVRIQQSKKRNDAHIISAIGATLLHHEASMDCTLTTKDNGNISFHRAVLAARSGFFEKLFFGFGEFKESQTNTVVVEGSTDAWLCIKSMVYTQKLSSNESAVLINALETVYCYDMEAFVPLVWETLSNNLNGIIAVKSLRVAGLHKNNTIGVDAMSYIMQNISSLIFNREWVKTYAEILDEIGGVPDEFVKKYAANHDPQW